VQLLASCAPLLFFLVSRFCESNYEQIKDATLDLFGKMEASCLLDESFSYVVIFSVLAHIASHWHPPPKTSVIA
jgi:hypothetical protein